MYYPGETVVATITLQVEHELKVQGGQFTLLGQEQYQYATKTYSTDSEGNTQETTSYEWGYNDLFASEGIFLDAGVLPAGTAQSYAFEVALPEDALPSASGEIERIAWTARAKLARPMAGDIHAEAALRVLSAPPGCCRPAG
jgi:hypothetical protein